MSGTNASPVRSASATARSLNEGRSQKELAGHAITLEDLVTRFQSASESLERSYRELQGRVQSLTEELEREREERIRLERLAAMGEMAMELAHEIRNPLGSIELYASMLDGEYAEQIVRSVRLLNHSVTNVLQFGRPVVPAPGRMSVSQLLEGTRVFLQPIAQQKQIRIVKDCDSDCFAVADYELLHRMLLNLVLNAVRETPRDGFNLSQRSWRENGKSGFGWNGSLQWVRWRWNSRMK